MRLAWTRDDGLSGTRCHCGEHVRFGQCQRCGAYQSRNARRNRHGQSVEPLIGPRQRLPQLKDISDEHVVYAVYLAALFDYVFWPYEFISRELQVPEKLAYRSMERTHDRGLVEYGVSLRSCWLDDKGRAMLTPFQLALYDAARGRSSLR